MQLLCTHSNPLKNSLIGSTVKPTTDMNPTLEALKAENEDLKMQLKLQNHHNELLVSANTAHAKTIAALQAEQGQEPVGYMYWGKQGFTEDSPGYCMNEPFVAKGYAPLFRHTQPTPPAEQWVSVKERLPDTPYECTSSGCHVSNSFCIAGIDEDGAHGMAFGMGHYQDDGKWICYAGEYSFQNIVTVTHYFKPPRRPPIDSTDAGDKHE